MKTERNKYIDILRTLAISYIIIYHIFAVANLKYKYNILNSILSIGGEIGVSIFFVISGFSIYKLLEKKKDTYNYKNYIIDRIKRIGPHYYLSIIFVLLLTNCAIYIGYEYLLNIVSHIFFFHNLFYNCHGAINGVLWTMGVIFQFYLIAPFLKKAIDDHPIITTIGSIAITIAFKYILFAIILPYYNANGMYYFIYGRQLFTTLDAFVLGMLVSKVGGKKVNNKNWILVGITLLSLAFMILYGSSYIKLFGEESLTELSIKGLFYYIVLDIIISFMLFGLSNCKYKDNKINKFLLFISKHEYAIYVWHLLIINSLIAYSSLYKDLIAISMTLTYIVLFILSIVISIILDVIVSNINWENVKKTFKDFCNKKEQ